MSLSLLDAYESSDDSDHESAKGEASVSGSAGIEDGNKNFFLGSSPNYDGSGSEADEDDHGSSSGEIESDSKNPPLPRPFENYDTAGMKGSSVSVFRNPYLEAEREDTSLLEQHVKLTETAFRSNLDEKRGRRGRTRGTPCRQFKRGRCRLGDECGFQHTIASTAPSSGELAASIGSSSTEPMMYSGKAIRYTEWGKEEVIDADNDEQKKNRKRRVGVTNSLIPPKKALASYEKQRQTEAPWLQKP